MTSRSHFSPILAAFVLASVAAAPLAAAPKPAPDPGGGVASLYADEQAGRSPLLDPRHRAAKLTTGLAALWARADAAVPSGEDGPIDFDVVTNSQGATVKSDTLTIERRDATHATVAAKLVLDNWLRASPRENVVRYDLVLDGARWRIDDVRGVAEPHVWSLRDLLTQSLREK